MRKNLNNTIITVYKMSWQMTFTIHNDEYFLSFFKFITLKFCIMILFAMKWLSWNFVKINSWNHVKTLCTVWFVSKAWYSKGDIQFTFLWSCFLGKFLSLKLFIRNIIFFQTSNLKIHNSLKFTSSEALIRFCRFFSVSCGFGDAHINTHAYKCSIRRIMRHQ